MATPKTQEQERIGTDNRTMNGAAGGPLNGVADVAPPLPTAGSPDWWAAVKALEHYDPAYPYDPAYEYDDDYTTDPDYGVDGVTHVTTETHKFSMGSFKSTVNALRGPCALREFSVYLTDAVRQALGPDHRFRDKGYLIPDVVVLQELLSPDEELPRACRLEADPPPLMVLEVLSATSWWADVGPKKDAYAAMGIAEYWLYDPEGHAPTADSHGLSFWGWRLNDTGTYVRIPRQAWDSEWPVYYSAGLAAHIRMLPAAARGVNLDLADELGEPHRLQWWDPIQSLWRDPEVDAQIKHRAEAQADTERQLREARAEAQADTERQLREVRAEAQADIERQLRETLLEERIVGMHAQLEMKFPDLPNVRADIEVNWRWAGQGRTTAEVAAVANGNAEWRSLLFPQAPEDIV